MESIRELPRYPKGRNSEAPAFIGWGSSRGAPQQRGVREHRVGRIANPLGLGTGTVQRISKERATSLRGAQQWRVVPSSPTVCYGALDRPGGDFSIEAPRVHHTARRCGVAARGAGAAASGAGGWVPPLLIARGLRKPPPRIP